MTNRPPCVNALVRWCVAAIVGLVLLTAPSTATAVASVPPESTTSTTLVTTTAVDNEFLPEDRSLGECISAAPQPGCGSKARGGWRQGLVFGVIAVGMAFIAWRIAVGARRARSAAR